MSIWDARNPMVRAPRISRQLICPVCCIYHAHHDASAAEAPCETQHPSSPEEEHPVWNAYELQPKPRARTGA